MARGIFPRAAFSTTRYARYSVWGPVFNHNGQMLLQRRSPTTNDNLRLWDEATGGHEDLRDSSTSITAKRELVEEMYLPRAEFTRHMRPILPKSSTSAIGIRKSGPSATQLVLADPSSTLAKSSGPTTGQNAARGPPLVRPSNHDAPTAPQPAGQREMVTGVTDPAGQRRPAQRLKLRA